MRLFRQKVGIEEFCHDYYISHVFRPRIDAGDHDTVFWDTLYMAIVRADPSAAGVEEAAFRHEFNAIRVELFGLAWVHILKEEEYIIREILFELRYLESQQLQRVWEAMADYNQAVLEAADAVQLRDQERPTMLSEWVASGGRTRVWGPCGEPAGH